MKEELIKKMLEISQEEQGCLDGKEVTVQKIFTSHCPY